MGETRRSADWALPYLIRGISEEYALPLEGRTLRNPHAQEIVEKTSPRDSSSLTVNTHPAQTKGHEL